MKTASVFVLPVELVRDLQEIASEAFQASSSVELTDGEFGDVGEIEIVPGARLTCSTEPQQLTFEITVCSHAVSIRVPVAESDEPAFARLVKTTLRALQSAALLFEQDLQLLKHTAQVSQDFEMLVSLQELASRIQERGLHHPADDLICELLPYLADMVVADDVIYLEANEGPEGSLHELARLPREGTSEFGEETLKELLALCVSNSPSEPTVLNQGELCPGLPETVASALLISMGGERGANRWLILIRGAYKHVTPYRKSGYSELEYGTLEAGMLMSVCTFLTSHRQNVQLYKEQEGLLIGVVRAMVNTIDAKDSYTSGHSDRVAIVARLLAAELGMSSGECNRIYLTGLLHDIGKIGVPDHVLLKPGRLTEEEFALIRKHPVVGYEVLRHLKPISYVLPGVLSHHESMDGTGYPQGLKGNEIPFEARILAVADAFDAMTSTRPYREGMSVEKASDILKLNSGTQWDPQVVDAFFRVRGQIVQVTGGPGRMDVVTTGAGSDDDISRAVGHLCTSCEAQKCEVHIGLFEEVPATCNHRAIPSRCRSFPR